jgi:hypothetical protein
VEVDFDLKRNGMDVALVATPEPVIERWLRDDMCPRWPTGATEIAPGLYIGELPDAISGEVERQCARLGETPVAVAVPFHSAFWEVVPPDASDVDWSPGHGLRHLMQVARLVRPHAGDLSWAATVRWRGDRVMATPARFERHTHICLIREEDAWLRPDDLAEVRTLWSAWTSLRATSGLPTRVARAMWYFEYVQCVLELDVRWPLLGTALEALIKVWNDQDGGSTAAFVHRGAALAQLAGVNWTSSWLRDVNEMRSCFAHGQPPGAMGQGRPAVRAEYAAFEDGLRSILRAAILHEEVRDAVASDDAIRRCLGTRARTPK